MYIIRCYAAFITALDDYLCHSSYAMLAGNFFILDELVLNNLTENYSPLDISIASTI
ncbi:MAG: hypothetical protein ACQJCO_09465 [cyanobacterium endosymbiont of Rhopalodia sterrenbergii]